MEDPRDSPGEPSAAREAPIALKRRKVRRGTQSCWECKRRKIRCTFATPKETTCDGCRSRRTRCIGQEFYDERVAAGKKVEEMACYFEPNPKSGRSRTATALLPGIVATDPTYSLDLDGLLTTNLNDLCSILFTVYPTQQDLDLILSIPVNVAILWHGTVCRPYSAIFSKEVAISSRGILEQPPAGSHPVLIARRLLLLASFLQGIPVCSASMLTGLSSDYRVIMSHLFNTSTRLVTSNDELLSSLEGIECVMIESMYLNNAGNLRRAWLANRKAMVLAQMLGLHTGIHSSGTILEENTRERIDPDYMWFRLVCTDRYLSLMLGLPQGCFGDHFADLTALNRCMAVDCMERMESVAAGLILQRNSVERTDLAATLRIDKMLQEAAALMPPQWWLTTPNLIAITGYDAEGFKEIIRVMSHFTHYHLLVQLHLPYMMLASNKTSYDYNKMTVVNASRAIVALFLSFRDSISTPAYCRGIDFIAFIASTTLCLAHIEARRQHRTGSIFQSLQHQRLADRGLLERTLEVMKTMAQGTHDIVAQKISDVLQPLLAIENNSSRGDSYNICASSDVDKQESQLLGDTSDAFHALHIQIPYFGTVKIEHCPTIPGTVETVQRPSEEQFWDPYTSHIDDSSLVVLHGPGHLNGDKEGELTSPSRQPGYELSPSYLLVPGLTAELDNWVLQGVDLALFHNFTQI
ncbi:hypothetical protein F5884DRAFT_817262 [Xylogone sp. PMI_703]|nr:hypothetical protein F5884DRAFT_817262 [Xylogone sp. PMI_703]